MSNLNKILEIFVCIVDTQLVSCIEKIEIIYFLFTKKLVGFFLLFKRKLTFGAIFKIYYNIIKLLNIIRSSYINPIYKLRKLNN